MTKTTVKMGMSRTSNSEVIIQIADDHSGDLIADISLTLKEMALLVTGLHGVKGKADIFENANIAKKRITEAVVFENNGFASLAKDQKSKAVKFHFDCNYANTDRILQDDGTRSQQKHGKHKYEIKKYVPVYDPFDVERYY